LGEEPFAKQASEHDALRETSDELTVNAICDTALKCAGHLKCIFAVASLLAIRGETCSCPHANNRRQASSYKGRTPKIIL
jgi:hypothetical protein